MKSATDAVNGVRAKDEEINDEKKEAMSKLKADTSKKVKAVNPVKSMKGAIKRSILK